MFFHPFEGIFLFFASVVGNGRPRLVVPPFGPFQGLPPGKRVPFSRPFRRWGLSLLCGEALHPRALAPQQAVNSFGPHCKLRPAHDDRSPGLGAALVHSARVRFDPGCGAPSRPPSWGSPSLSCSQRVAGSPSESPLRPWQRRVALGTWLQTRETPPAPASVLPSEVSATCPFALVWHLELHFERLDRVFIVVEMEPRSRLLL